MVPVLPQFGIGLAQLSTGSVVRDVLVGVGIAVVLFALYYVLVLGPARRPSRRDPSESAHRNDPRD